MTQTKQQNKKHGTLGHKSKRIMKNVQKGRVMKEVPVFKKKHKLSKLEKKHSQNQKRKFKTEEAIKKKKRLGTNYAPPFLITILPFQKKLNSNLVLEKLAKCDYATYSDMMPDSISHIGSSKLKQRYSFISPPVDDMTSILDASKVSDVILCVWDCEQTDLSVKYQAILSSIKAQGLPTVIHAVHGLEDLAQKGIVTPVQKEPCDLNVSFNEKLRISFGKSDHNKKARALKTLKKLISLRFEEPTKIFSLGNPVDTKLLLRQIGEQKQHKLSFREMRSHMIAEEVSYSDNDAGESVVKVTGYIRGRPMSANGIIHICGYGDYQVKLIEGKNDQNIIDPVKSTANARSIDIRVEPNLAEQESLQAELEPEMSDNEQELPEDEIEEEENDQESSETSKKRKRKHPEGVSSYQACWYQEDVGWSEDESDEGSSDVEMDENFIPPKAPSTIGYDSDECDLDVDLGDIDDVKYDRDEDYEKEKEHLEKLKAASSDVSYPDEVDTPTDHPARLRFAKYRGLESFRKTPWYDDEKVPYDYRRIYKISNYTKMKNTIMKNRKSYDNDVETGHYVTVHIKNAPEKVLLDYKIKRPIVIFELMPTEQRMTLLNVAIKSHSLGHYRSIKSKERLIFNVGYRRFTSSPIFSEHTLADKHKFLRYFHTGDTVIASMYAPMAITPCPVAVFKERPDGTQDLIGTGSVYKPGEDRIIIKRIVLSGYPYKIHPKETTVRFMFYNKEDIEYYKSVKLRTKWGLSGHIVSSIGTHGHMKCVFNGPVKSQDTALMFLYKRVYPKWSYEESPRIYLSQDVFEDDCEDNIEELPPSKRQKIVRFVDAYFDE